nr:unnamed protein product [Digitaria exilis]
MGAACTHLPLLEALHALGVELLDGDDHADAGSRGVHGLLVDPPLVHPPEPALAEHRVGLEVAGRGPELTEGEDAQAAARLLPLLQLRVVAMLLMDDEPRDLLLLLLLLGCPDDELIDGSRSGAAMGSAALAGAAAGKQGQIDREQKRNLNLKALRPNEIGVAKPLASKALRKCKGKQEGVVVYLGVAGHHGSQRSSRPPIRLPPSRGSSPWQQQQRGARSVDASLTASPPGRSLSSSGSLLCLFRLWWKLQRPHYPSPRSLPWWAAPATRTYPCDRRGSRVIGDLSMGLVPSSWRGARRCEGATEISSTAAVKRRQGLCVYFGQGQMLTQLAQQRVSAPFQSSAGRPGGVAKKGHLRLFLGEGAQLRASDRLRRTQRRQSLPPLSIRVLQQQQHYWHLMH